MNSFNENQTLVRARFIIGPAGSGKTFCCLAEIREALSRNDSIGFGERGRLDRCFRPSAENSSRKGISPNGDRKKSAELSGETPARAAETVALPNPMASSRLGSDSDGPPLIFLAPKQATFQLERQLLADENLRGYTRLRILSFERLANHILDLTGQSAPTLLSEDGRVMVLHALLARRRKELQIFHASAGLPGFAQQLSVELRELQQRQITPEILRQLCGREDLSDSLRRKLHDLSVLLTDYLNWLRSRNLQDAECLFGLAVDALAKSKLEKPVASALWLDGFAEMTPSELDLLAAVGARCGEASLNFCLETSSADSEASWLSIWTGLGETYRQCHGRFAALPRVSVALETLRRDSATGRFAGSRVLRHLEKNWAVPSALEPDPAPTEKNALRLVECADPAAEATMAAREILRFVRGGGRYREAAVLVRTLDGYHDHLRRAFARYEIPFFLDRRRPVAQHPLAELTRSVLRAAVFGWQHEDLFAALKSGLVTNDEAGIDRLENEAMARGWKGETWFGPLPFDSAKSDWAERFRRKWIGPFSDFKTAFTSRQFRVDGPALAQIIQQLWSELEVEKKLEEWTAREDSEAAVHGTIWDQLNEWLKDIALAFAGESMALRDWLPILESGLAQLSVGVIPPVLDQVLIGAIDRSRNPELKLAVLIGVNETVFPAKPPGGHLLIEADRDELAKYQIRLSHGRKEFLSRERFFGYIACTRASEQLTVSYAQKGNDGSTLNPSPLITLIARMFPQWSVEKFTVSPSQQPEHLCELAGRLARAGNQPSSFVELLQRPAFASLREQMASFKFVRQPQSLEPGQADRLYGAALRTSVSRLEEFAACSYRFFVRVGLKAEERKQFELDARERGSFQHEVLERFHRTLRSENKKWRDITPDDARRRIQIAVDEILPAFREGLLGSTAQSRFSARAVTETLQDFAASMVDWMAHYQFDPFEVELSFGMEGGLLPAWEIDLGGGRRLAFRGKIDRIDLCMTGSADEALAVVIDYKSSAKDLEDIRMRHGLQLQLAAYLGFLRHLADSEKVFGIKRLIPAGVFYVNLRGGFSNGKTRREMLATREQFRQMRFQHSGRFDFTSLPYLDARGDDSGTQFKFKINADGKPHARNSDLMAPESFIEMLDHVEAELARMGKEIYEGEIGLNPYQKGAEIACDRCEYQAICRFDPWENSFRVLK